MKEKQITETFVQLYGVEKFNHLFKGDLSWGIDELDYETVMLIGFNGPSMTRLYVIVNLRTEDEPSIVLELNEDMTKEEVKLASEGLFPSGDNRWGKLLMTISMFQM